MLIQTWAIFVDGYRELNAKKLFWIVLGLSVLIVAAFAGIGVSDGKMTFFTLRTGIVLPMSVPDFYRLIFTEFGIKFWLTFIAAILALVSTASIFPDFLTGGSIDLYLSKPVGRLRLFLTKYVSGLLFAALQVLVFCLACFFVIGLRAQSWDCRIFLAVPIVVCFFSYLFSISTLLGVLTRSTVAAVLLTMLLWSLIWAVDQAEYAALLFRTSHERQLAANQGQLRRVDAQIAEANKAATTRPFGGSERLQDLQSRRARLDAEVRGSAASNVRLIHRILYSAKSELPKTRETTDLLNRWLTPASAGRPPQDEASDRPAGPFSPNDARAVQQHMSKRPIWWVVGTSLGFEAAMLAIAAWLFVRRDY